MLLAGTSPTSVVEDTTGDDWEADRLALEGRSLSFTDFLEQRGLVLRTDLLGAWSAWLTPVFEPRRYRTWFFVAALPAGQLTRDVSTESSSVTWMGALDAASAVDAGELLMLPPTYLTCLEVGLHASPRDVLAAAAARPPVEMFMPEVEGAGDSAVAVDPRAAAHAGGAAALVTWSGGSFGCAGGVRAGRQRLADDPRRHQHLGAPRARWVAVGGGRPRAVLAGAPGRGARGGRRTWPWCC